MIIWRGARITHLFRCGHSRGGIYTARRLSKNSLAPSGRGLRPQAVGERASRRHEGFRQRRGSLPPALRATAPPLAQAPPPPYRGSLSPRGRFFDTRGRQMCRPYNAAMFYRRIVNKKARAAPLGAALVVSCKITCSSCWRPSCAGRGPECACGCAGSRG